MRRGRSLFIASLTGALLALLASSVGASDIGVCPPYSKTFGPEDSPDQIAAFLGEINQRPAGGTLNLEPGQYELPGLEPVTGVVCVRSAQTVSLLGPTVDGVNLNVASNGILTLHGMNSEVFVGEGGILFATESSVRIEVAQGGFADVRGPSAGAVQNEGTLLLTDVSIVGGCDYTGGGITIGNSGRLIMDHVHYTPGCNCSGTKPGDEWDCGEEGIENSGIVTMVNATIEAMDGQEDDGESVLRSGSFELQNSLIDRGDDTMTATCDGAAAILDLGYNTLPTIDGCVVLDQQTTTIDLSTYAGSDDPVIDRVPLDLCRAFDRVGSPRVDGDGDGIVLCDVGSLEFSGTAITVKSPPFWLEYGELDLATATNLYVVLKSNPVFDPADVVVESVVFGDTDALPRGWNYVDRNKDGVPDLRLRYRLWDVDLACGRQEIEVSASTTDGRVVTGVLKLDVTGCSF